MYSGETIAAAPTANPAINRVGKAGKRSTIELFYTHNRQTKVVTLDRVLLNGKRQDLASGAINLNNLNLFKLQLN